MGACFEKQATISKLSTHERRLLLDKYANYATHNLLHTRSTRQACYTRAFLLIVFYITTFSILRYQYVCTPMCFHGKGGELRLT